ncbi:ABC transporter substrate-binding protein [Chondromyces crocatus]|uniref:Cytochrome c domain-containing protein n=1 Tax=Chondromyces crocatus TaxID=52 RepID=A0A0K1E9T6_CHOCO|nr:ABC transporter substrate-binding protein [Chondromyces crocatus]AKT37625.1 uncharacterized protein CMC5_017670 [Chondromyces crocatus]
MAVGSRRALSWLLRGATLGLCAAAFAVPGTASGPVASSGRAEASSCVDLSPSARRGRRIFHRGMTEGGRPVEGAIVGGASMLSGREAACARCHGSSGEGTEEGGVKAPPISAERLATATREREAVDRVALAQVVRAGRVAGVGGARLLHPVMPRYALSDAEFEDLASYLRCVGRDLDPGVTEEVVTLGAALPLSGPVAPVGQAARAVIGAVFGEVNEKGGVYRRRLELVVEDSAGAGGEDAATTRLLERGVLALVSSAWSGAAALGARLEEERVPLLGPLGHGVLPGGEVIFQIQPGPDVLARVAVEHLMGSGADALGFGGGKGAVGATGASGGAAGRTGARGGAAGRAGAREVDVLVVHAKGWAGEAWAEGARVEARRRGLHPPEVVSFDPERFDPAAMVEAVQRRGSQAVLFWGPGDALARCAEIRWGKGGNGEVALYAPLSAVSEDGEVRRRVGERALLLYPGPVGEQARATGEALRAFLSRAGVEPEVAPSVQASAYAAARLAIEALKRAGAHATRERVITALEAVRGFDAGPVPPVSFARNRRVGVMGASLLRLDPRTGDAVRASGWIDVVP